MSTVQCKCGSRLNLQPKHFGRVVRCSACRSPLRTIGPGESHGFRYSLIVQHGPAHVGEQIFLGGTEPLQVGKVAECDLALVGPSVSRKHCRLVPADGGWAIEDQGSRNGLFVNAHRVGVMRLRHGDSVRVGEFELVFQDTAGEAAAPASAPAAKEEAGSGEYGISAMPEPVHEFAPPQRPTNTEPGPECPGCKKRLAPRAKICVDCGIDVRTGRSILTADESGMDETYATAEGLIGWVSWVIPFGIYPIASEAFGKCKPHVIRGIALVTIAVSVAFWGYTWTDSSRHHSAKNMLLWSGDAKPTAEHLALMCEYGDYGDLSAWEARYYAMAEAEGDEETGFEPEFGVFEGDRALAAHAALPPEQQCVGTFHAGQLITHAFLHADILHLLGNLLFLMVFGTRVNALIGGLGAAIVYPLLAVAGAVGHLLSMAGQQPSPMLGASGAIMGLAGMYLVLFPAHRVHMATWMRWGLVGWFRLHFNLFAVRGIWVVLFYIAFDVFYTALGVQDGTAHWAHLGGFLVGMAIAFMLLVTRLVNARGGDLLSVLLGRRAWALVGKPSTERNALLGG